MATIDLTSGSFSFSLTVNPQFGNDFLHEVVSGTDYFLAGTFQGPVSQGSWTVDISFANSFNLTYTGPLEADGQTGTATAMSYSFVHQQGQNSGAFSNINIDMTALANMDSSTRKNALDANLRSYDYTVNGTEDGQVIVMTGLSTSTTVYANGGDDVVITDSGHDYIEGGSGNDAIDARLGNDLVYGGDGNDTIVGGEGVDKSYGGADDDRFQLIASSLSAGETYDGGTGADVLALTSGGLFDLTQVTLTDIESIAVEGSTATTVKVSNLSGLPVISAETADTTVDIVDITTDPGVDAAERVFRLLENGVDTVTWTLGGVGRTATIVDADTMRITRADGIETDITFDTENRIRLDAVITDVNDVAAYDRVELVYDANGKVQFRTSFNDDATETFTEYFDGVRTLTTRTDTSNPGAGPAWASITTNYESNGQITSRTALMDNATRVETNFFAGVRTDATQTDMSANGTGQNWQTIRVTYDSDGVTKMTRQVTFDNGVSATKFYTGGVVASEVKFDNSVNGTAVDWSQIQMSYDNSGVLEDLTIYYDNGGRRETTYQQGQLVLDTRYEAGGVVRFTGGAMDNVISGTGAADVIRAGAGNDTITSHGGNDTLTGGNGDDVFIFDSFFGAIDNDVITDFGNGADRLDLQGFGIYTVADLLATGAGHTASQVGADTVIDFEAAGSLTLRNLTLGSLTDAHFINLP